MDTPCPRSFASGEDACPAPPLPAAIQLPRWASDRLIIVAQLVEAACKARDGDHEATKAHIERAVRLLQQNPTLSRNSPAPVLADNPHLSSRGLPAWQARRVMAHIESNLSKRICVRELARLLGLSASHFSRAFKQAVGASPRAYVLRRRIEVAQGLMLTSSESLSAIALACGMCDQAHFTRSFRRIVGETPHSWRRIRRSALTLRLAL